MAPGSEDNQPETKDELYVLECSVTLFKPEPYMKYISIALLS